MHFILKLHFLKHNHSSKTLECLCPLLPYMFRSLTLTILRGIVPVALLLSALLLFLGTTLSGHVAVFLFVLLCVPSRCSSSCILSFSSRRQYTTGRAAGEHTQQHKQKHSQMPR
jgi:hypothetical protein